MRFALIGGSGGLGALIADHLLLEGHEVESWSRSAKRSLDVLDPRPEREAFEVDRMVYLAWSTSDRSAEIQGRHAEAATRWSEQASALGVRFLFVSTVLAAPAACSEYGRAKLAAERGVAERHGRITRVGLVVDDGYPELLASRLRRVARRTPWGARLGTWPVLPVSGATAARTILDESSHDDVKDSAPVLVAERQPVPLVTIITGDPGLRLHPTASEAVAWLAHHYPTSRGTIGRHADALRGLALTRPDMDGARDPIEGPVPIGDWRRGIKG